MDAASEEKIEKIRSLYERASTPGEKAAAKAALDRLGANVARDFEVAVDRFAPTLWRIRRRSDGKIAFVSHTRAPTADKALALARGSDTYWVDN
jgi:hypothetical protein